MYQNVESPEPVTVDFNTEFPDKDFNYEPVKVTINPNNNPAPPQPKQDDGLLDLSDEATLDKLSAGGFLRIRPEGQNVISVAFFKPAVIMQTHFSQERKKTIRCLKPASTYCCEKLGEARDVIGVIAVQYAAASGKDGTLKKGADPDLRVGYMTLSKSALSTMRKGLPEGATLYSVDWKVAKKANGIGYDYFFQRPTPLYKTLNLQHEVEQLIAPYADGVKLKQRVAKPLTIAEVKALLSGDPELGEGDHLDDTDAL
jgi:hypothetical protein